MFKEPLSERVERWVQYSKALYGKYPERILLHKDDYEACFIREIGKGYPLKLYSSPIGAMPRYKLPDGTMVGLKPLDGSK